MTRGPPRVSAGFASRSCRSSIAVFTSSLAAFTALVGPVVGQAPGKAIRVCPGYCLEIDLCKDEAKAALVVWMSTHGGARDLTAQSEPAALLERAWELVGGRGWEKVKLGTVDVLARDPRINPRAGDSVRVRRPGYRAQRRFVLFVNSAARRGDLEGSSLLGWGTRANMSTFNGNERRQSLGEWRQETVDAEIVTIAAVVEP